MNQDLFFQSEYFINNDNGLENPYIFSTDLVDIRVYCNKLTSEQLDEIKSEFLRVAEGFFGTSPKGRSESFFKMSFDAYVFEDSEKYKKIRGISFKKLKGYCWTFNNFQPKKYFINGENGYEKPYTIELTDYTMKVNCYYNNLTSEQLQKIKEAVEAVFKEFFEKIPEAINAGKNLETIKINIFNNKEDYQPLECDVLNCITTELGVPACFRHLDSTQRGPQAPQTEISISDPGNLKGLRHELAHALTFYTLESAFKFVPRFLIEGIGEYFADKSESELTMLTAEESAGLTLRKLKELYGRKNNDRTRLLYRTGYSLVNYLQAEHPGLINQYFTDLRNCKLENDDLNYLVRKFIKIFGIKIDKASGLIKKYIDNKTIKKFKSKIKPVMSILEKYKDTEKWLLQRIKEPSTVLETYFINGDKGYENPTTIELKEYNLKIIYYYNNKLSSEQSEAIDKTISELCKDFYKELPDARNVGEGSDIADKELAIIEIYFVNNREDYFRIAREAFGTSKEVNSLGFARHRGISHKNSTISKNTKKILISNVSDLRILRHELAHGLVFQATGTEGQRIPFFLKEGIATHFENNAKSNLSMLTAEESAELILKKLKNLEWACEGKDCLDYRIAHSLVNYLQAKYPTLINQYLIDLRNCNKEVTTGDFSRLFVVFHNILSAVSRFFPRSIAERMYDFEMERIKIAYRDVMFERLDSKLEPITSILSNYRDTEEWLLQHREQPSTDKGGDIHSAVVQQMAGDESPSTSLSSFPMVADLKSSEVLTDNIVGSGRH